MNRPGAEASLRPPSQGVLFDLRGVFWGPAGRAEILSDINLCLPAGQVVAICGANGAGKSSLLRLLYRHHRPSRGGVAYKGRDLWQMPGREVARQVAAVLQEQPFDLDLTVAQVVALGRLPHRAGLLPSARDREICAEALERMELTALSARRLATLSGGERQRVALARALAQEPEVIILDEPTNHLDIRHQLELLSLLRGLGRTVITTLHDLGQAADFADRVLLMHRGRILSDGPPGLAMTEAHLSTAFALRARVDTTGPRTRFDFHL